MKEETSIQKQKPSTLSKMSVKEKIDQAETAFLNSFPPEDQAKAFTTWQKEKGFALQIFHNNDYLAKMDPISIVTSIINVALTGLSLNPELKLGYLVPRKGKLYFQSSYQGKREILMRAGIVQDVKAVLVYTNDQIEIIEGSNASIRHQPNYFGDRGKLVGGYWTAILKNGQKPFGVMPVARMEEIRLRSESVKAEKNSPWITDYEEMCKKTILNWGFKSLPKTGIPKEILEALEADAQLDNDEFAEWKKKQEASQKDDWMEDSSPGGVTEATVVPTPALPKKTPSDEIFPQ